MSNPIINIHHYDVVLERKSLNAFERAVAAVKETAAEKGACVKTAIADFVKQGPKKP